MRDVQHTCDTAADKYCREGADPRRHPDHDSHAGGCICPLGPRDSTNFGLFWLRTYRNGGWGEALKLRPGQVSIHDGDVTTRVYDLAGLGRGAGEAFRAWAQLVYERDNHSTSIVGDWPRLAAEYQEL